MEGTITTVEAAEAPSATTDTITIRYSPSAKAEQAIVSWFKRNRETLTGIGTAVTLSFVARFVVLATMYLGTRIIPGKDMKMATLSWDAGWYYNAAMNGYPHDAVATSATNYQSTIAFFPLYPMLTRFVHELTGLSIARAGVVVSVVSAAVATAFIWLIARHLLDKASANRAAALFSFFPSSIALSLMMSEGVTIACAAACLYFLIKKQWLWAGLASALATSARPTAVALCFACAWASFVAIDKNRDWKSLIAPILSPLGILAYFAFLKHHTGDFLAWMHAEQAGWGYSKTDHLVAFKALSVLWNHPLANTDKLVTAIALLTAIGGVIAMAAWYIRAKPRPDFALVVYTVCLLALSFGTGGPASKLRYLLGAFPLAIAVARWARTEARFAALIGTSGAAMGVYTLMETHTLFSVL
jgi:hypothetical protein